MKISIITVCFNSAKTISDTINSVASQDYPAIEHIIVDGASTDDTVDILEKAPSVAHFVSEPDKGIYDAMNKGIAMATGDVVGILNADDFYLNKSVISQIAQIFNNEDVDACYADLVYVKETDTNKIIRYWRSQPFKPGLFLKGWMPAHPTFFVRKSVYQQHGLFNLNYRIAADVEMLFRLLEVKRINTVYLPETIIKMRLGGTTNKSLKNIQKQNQEVLMILDAYYDRVSRIHFFVSKILNRCQQFLSRPPSL
ncbi:glycosyltransferase family 2 protein [uncultured Methylophaga sp.]|jgi:glycosyltransferase involved in cell wall biosynthesis|uniref:glycosyltransferase family 2 protein n=1 Tax=uncultured Methylophaga sp. TaxID=285271 RepID=UPI0026104E68|nr:glycosyltransferase family 2 protein [uncultured Methylophaga sp.]|tara:strand:+ start:21179 stop:21940 length:762 start_codon:yes stop_codon:yes gene_type:complete